MQIEPVNDRELDRQSRLLGHPREHQRYADPLLSEESTVPCRRLQSISRRQQDQISKAPRCLSRAGRSDFAVQSDLQ
jgi:hypothetical protein